MKKIIFVMLSVFTFLLCNMYLDASTVLSTSEVGTGRVDTSLVFSEGFSSGLDVTIQIQGNVKFEGLEWSSSLSESYTKRYFYDSNSNSLRVIIATGDLSKNLLDKNGKVNIGVVKFSNGTSDSQNFNLDLKSTTIVEAEYKSISINEISTNSNSYVINVNESSSGNNNNNSNNNNTNNPDNSSNGSSNGSNASRPGNNGNVSNENGEENPDEENQDREDGNQNEDDDSNQIIDIDTSINDNEADGEDSSQKEEKSSRSIYLWIGVGILVLLAIVGRITSSRKK